MIHQSFFISIIHFKSFWNTHALQLAQTPHEITNKNPHFSSPYAEMRFSPLQKLRHQFYFSIKQRAPHANSVVLIAEWKRCPNDARPRIIRRREERDETAARWRLITPSALVAVLLLIQLTALLYGSGCPIGVWGFHTGASILVLGVLCVSTVGWCALLGSTESGSITSSEIRWFYSSLYGFSLGYMVCEATRSWWRYMISIILHLCKEKCMQQGR